MALLWIAYERLLNAIHNEDTLANYHAEGRRLGPPALRGPLARSAVADAARVASSAGSAALVTGEVTLRLRRGEDYSILDTRGPACPTTRTSCRWSAPPTRPSARSTASGS